jgi:hypothetical protein
MLGVELDAHISISYNLCLMFCLHFVLQPGIASNTTMCLWNGFIASTPGHPFLVQALETLVNQVRNRFTTIDISSTFCPRPELSVLYGYDTLFITGPCMLGGAANKVLGRSLQSSFKAGEIHTNKVPGRTIILHQDKSDLGSHRYTDLTRNAIVFATGFEQLEDVQNKIQKLGKYVGKHYKDTQARTGAFATRGVYVNRKKSNEDIRIVIDTDGSSIRLSDSVDDSEDSFAQPDASTHQAEAAVKTTATQQYKSNDVEDDEEITSASEDSLNSADEAIRGTRVDQAILSSGDVGRIKAMRFSGYGKSSMAFKHFNQNNKDNEEEAAASEDEGSDEEEEENLDGAQVTEESNILNNFKGTNMEYSSEDEPSYDDETAEQ